MKTLKERRICKQKEQAKKEFEEQGIEVETEETYANKLDLGFAFIIFLACLLLSTFAVYAFFIKQQIFF